MAYGPMTSMTIGKLNSGKAFSEANNWSPDDFTLPFAERLAENIAEYRDLPSGEKARQTAIFSLVRKGAEEKGIRFSRNTLHEWMQGGRDPSVSSSDRQTRENIYKLCAVLDYDFELTQEAFEKVFFTRAFNPKDRKELAFRYYARKDFPAGTQGGSWYKKGEAAAEEAGKLSVTVMNPRAIKDSVQIMDLTELMDEKEFIYFLASNPATFVRDNENVAAKKEIKRFAGEACRLLGKENMRGEIPYEALIGDIIGYTQRNATQAVGTVSSLKSLPAQLTTNFPTGQILRKICLDEECSYDQVYKMLSLLLFFYYFAATAEKADAERSFLDFLRFANQSLDRAGCQPLSPHQPYGGLLLFCAAQKKPIFAFREFIREKTEEESEAALQEEIRRAFPHWKNSVCLALARHVGLDPFLVRTMIGTLSRTQCDVLPEDLQRGPAEEESFLQHLYEDACFSEREKAVLRYFSLFPPEGISGSLLERIIDDEDRRAAAVLLSQNWVSRKKDLWSMDYRIRRTVNGQLEFPQVENCLPLVNAVDALDPQILDRRDYRNFERLQKKITALKKSRQNNR